MTTVVSDEPDMPPPLDDEDIFAPVPFNVGANNNTLPATMAASVDLFTSAAEDIDLTDEPETIADVKPTLILNSEPGAAVDDDEWKSISISNSAPPAEVVPVVNSSHRPPSPVSSNPSPNNDTPKTQIMPCTHVEEAPLRRLNFKVSIPKYEKVGEGLSCYVRYLVVFEPTAIGQYSDSRYEVWRRFSDFLGLFDRLQDKHAQHGRVIPEPPSKDAAGNVVMKTRVGKDDDVDTDHFLESRRRSLERYLIQTAKHPLLCVDLEFREFVTSQSQLKRSSDTSMFSMKNISKSINIFTDKLTKVTAPIKETDPYFQSVAEWADTMHADLEKLAYGFDVTTSRRKEYCQALGEMQYSLGLLAAAEESVSLSRALSSLSKTHEDIALAHDAHGNADLHVMADFAHTHASMLQAIKMALMERAKSWQRWQDAQSSLNAKRTKKTQLELAALTAKVPQAKLEVEEAEKFVDQCEGEFNQVSKTLRADIQYYDADRISEFRATLLQYLRELSTAQAQIVEVWQRFKPEADAIEINGGVVN